LNRAMLFALRWERISSMKVLISLLGLLLLSTGCAPPTSATSYGKDSYIVSVDDYWGVYSPGRLQVKAAEQANAYCSHAGKVLRVRNAAGQGTTGWTSTSATLVFSCIDQNDPENTRPDVRVDSAPLIQSAHTAQNIKG
jgi:hypothetical protein